MENWNSLLRGLKKYPNVANKNNAPQLFGNHITYKYIYAHPRHDPYLSVLLVWIMGGVMHQNTAMLKKS